MKKLILAAVLALSPTLAFAGALDNYNAGLNTPAAKAAYLKSVCGASDAGSFNLCEKMKRDGVHNSDVRVGIVATAALVGGVAGGALFVTPGVIGQSGALTLGTWVPTLGQAIAVGVGAGAVVGTASYLAD